MKRDLIVRSLNQRAAVGVASIGTICVPCGLGRSGMTAMKREGDGATPIGRWPILRVMYRPDRLHGPGGAGVRTGFGIRGEPKRLRMHDGWCDARGDRNYNRPVQYPYPASAEKMWRDDHLYDVVLILGHNQRPRIQGGGSAIFLHIARDLPDGGLAATEGCVALRRRDLAIMLRMLGPGSTVRVVR